MVESRAHAALSLPSGVSSFRCPYDCRLGMNGPGSSWLQRSLSHKGANDKHNGTFVPLYSGFEVHCSWPLLHEAEPVFWVQIQPQCSPGGMRQLMDAADCR